MVLLTVVSVHTKEPEIIFGEQSYLVEFNKDLPFFK